MKKNHIVKILSVICLALLLFISISCEDDDDTNAEVALKSFGPSPALRGGELRFIGDNLDQVTAIVLPENIEVTDFVSKSNTEIVIVIPHETAIDGKVVLKTPAGDIETKSRLGISEPISLTSFEPTTVLPGDELTITGTYLNLITEVIFAANKSVTEFDSQSETEIVLHVPEDAQTGVVVLSNGEEIPILVKSKDPLTVTLPSIASVSPLLIKAGSVLTIAGANLDLAESVTFAGGATVTTFESQSATEVSVIVPSNAQDGPVVIRPASKVDVTSSSSITMVVPVITSLTPNPAKNGGDVVIAGTDLDLVNKVVFGGNKTGTIAAGGTATQITVKIPADATEDKITVSTASNKSVVSGDVLALVKPVITNFTPTSVQTVNSPSITITGTDLDIVSKIIFEGGWEAPVSSASATQIVIDVVPGSVTGPFTLVANNGAKTVSATPLTIVPNVPNITVLPTIAYVGEFMTITGTNLDVMTSMTFPEGKVATEFGSKTPTMIEVRVPSTTSAGLGVITFTTAKNEIYKSAQLEFRFPGPEPIVNAALMINGFDETGHDLGWDNWGSNVELGNDSNIKFSGKYLHGTKSTAAGWTWIWGCDHSQLAKVSVTKADHLLKMDVRITKPIAPGTNFQIRLAGTDINLGNLGGSTNGWKTITFDLSTFGSLPATIPASGDWGMILQSAGTVDLTGLYVDNIRFQAK